MKHHIGLDEIVHWGNYGAWDLRAPINRVRIECRECAQGLSDMVDFLDKLDEEMMKYQTEKTEKIQAIRAMIAQAEGRLDQEFGARGSAWHLTIQEDHNLLETIHLMKLTKVADIQSVIERIVRECRIQKLTGRELGAPEPDPPTETDLFGEAEVPQDVAAALSETAAQMAHIEAMDTEDTKKEDVKTEVKDEVKDEEMSIKDETEDNIMTEHDIKMKEDFPSSPEPDQSSPGVAELVAQGSVILVSVF